ncbi:hemerythrin domain-containing protein [Nonomuraea bangladeshensis]|uniref:Hemerythrin domain-containing protein n=1 Tax=Nonomuraea bangladeshensis TaxID=404385 RepID=A0ABV3GWF5_9ACTN
MAEHDVIDLLVAQHGRIRDLFDEVEQAPPDKVEAAFARLTRMLSMHETAEEEIVHPYARRKLDNGPGVVADRLREESLTRRLLQDLHHDGVDHPRFWDRLAELRAAVTAHARGEERYEFARLRARTTPVERRAMGAALRAAEGLATIRPHAGAESATRNLLVGTPRAVAERARDAIRRALGRS